MKKFLTVIIAVAVIMLIMPVSITASASVVDTMESEATVQPRLNKKVTIALGNTWVDIHTEDNWLDANLTVTNYATSVYDVDIRILKNDHSTILHEGKTIASGKYATFYNIKSGGYIIQGKSADDEPHEYTLTLRD